MTYDNGSQPPPFFTALEHLYLASAATLFDVDILKRADRLDLVLIEQSRRNAELAVWLPGLGTLEGFDHLAR